MTVLHNVKLKWAFLAQPNTKGDFASNKYQVDVVLEGANLDTVNSLKNNKQKVKDKDGIKTITLKSSRKPRVYTATGALMSDAEIAKIGNDSVAHVIVEQYDAGKFGKMLGLGSIKVVELKAYTAGDNFEDGSDTFDEGLI